MSKLTDLQFLTTLNRNDLVHIVDVSNTTDDPEGSSFKCTLGELLDFFLPVSVSEPASPVVNQLWVDIS